MIEVSKWVRKFQRLSWEPEILISGGILFTLFQAQSALILTKNYFYPLASPGLSITLGLFAVGISALTVGFSLHLITKTFWIALLALKSVFPGGINLKKLNYSESFLRKESIDNSLKSSISKIGNTSSLMFVVSFLVLLIFFGIGTYVILMTGLLYFFPLGRWFNIPVLGVFIVPLILPFVDFITLGSLKKGKIVSKVYYPFYKIISWMTLSFLYRDILYTLISNIPKRRLVLFSLLFIISTSILGYRNIAGYLHFDTAFNNWTFFDDGFFSKQSMDIRKYENLRNSGDPIIGGNIHSDVINEKHIKLYLRYQHWMDRQLKNLAESNQSLSDNQIMNMYFDIKIDNISADSVAWNYTSKTDISQFGIVGFVPILNLEYGPHLIEVYTNENLLFTAPFWKE